MRGRDRLLSRSRLSGEDGLVTLEAVHLQESHVGGHDVAEAESHDIAGNELDNVDLLHVPVTLHKSRAADLRVESLDGLLGAILVDETERDADADDGHDDRCLGDVPDHGSDDRGRQQKRQQKAAQLPTEHAPEADAVATQSVGTGRLQPPCRFLASQTVGTRSQSLEDLNRRQRGSLGESERAPAVRRGRCRRAHRHAALTIVLPTSPRETSACSHLSRRNSAVQPLSLKGWM